MRRKILVVDDVKVNRLMLKKMLSADYEVLEASNGEEALSVLKNTYADLSAVLLDIIMPVMDGYAVLEQMRKNPLLTQIPVIVTTGNTDGDAEIKALTLGANDFITKPYVLEIIKRRLQNTINLRETAAAINALQKDELTGLYNRETFLKKAAEMIAAQAPGYYVMCCFDIKNFKVINDQYGNQKGDEVLAAVAHIFKTGFDKVGGLVGRIMADNFAILYPLSFMDTETLAKMRKAASVLDGSIPPISFSIGRYIIDDLSLPVSAMYDRAAIAVSSIKGRFDETAAMYDESMRERLLYEQEIENDMRQALAERQFEVWYQPQYNHATGAIIGAEALVRWRHPAKGLIYPGKFIPIFERNGFIYELDKFVWEEACTLLKKWSDAGRSPLPISVNVSRYELLRADLTQTVLDIVGRCDIPRDLLRLEITESAFSESAEVIIQVVRDLIAEGFTVEIDDFGSGYSSLNTLKDVPAQIVKLDMRFLEDGVNNGRGGNILESIVRMSKWLGMSVIAEGVETMQQADYLKSIGCNYVQGYLYARPVPLPEYEALTQSAVKEEKLMALETVENLDNNAFWDPNSMDTLIFNTYIGGACIFEWYQDRIELLRANDKYAKTIGGPNCTITDTLNLKWEEHMCADTAAATKAAILQTIETLDDVTYEAVYFDLPGTEGNTYLRTTFRAIARTGNRHLLYATNENITAQRNAERKVRETVEQMQAVMDNVGSGITAVTTQGEDVKYLFVNDRYFEILGYTREQYFSEVVNTYDLIHPDDRHWVQKAVARINDTGKAAALEYRVFRRDGTVMWERNAISVTHFDGIDAPVHLGVMTDITAERLAAEKIRSLNENLTDMMNDMPGGFVRLRALPDNELSAVYVNDAFRRLVGHTDEASPIMGNYRPLDNIHPDDTELVRDTVIELIETGQTRNIQYRIRRLDGTYLPVNVFGRATTNEAGETYINIYFADLSEEEKRDMTMRDTLPYVLSAIMRNSDDLAFAKDKDFRYICCSPAFVKFTRQKSESDVIGKDDYDFWTKEEADHFRGDDMKLYETGEPLISYIEPIPSDDGIQHYCRTSKYILRDSTGEIVGMYGIGRDITQNRTAYEQLQLLTNSIPGGIASYEHSPEGIRILYFNDGFCGMMGYTREEYEAITETGAMNITVQEDIPGLLARVNELIQSDAPLNHTYRIRTKSGGVMWANVRGSVSERRGDKSYINIVLFDVTETKLAEEAALIHEQEMRMAISQMGRMICEYDPATHILTVPEAFAARYNRPSTVADVPDSLIASGVIDERTVPAYRGFFDAILRGEKTGVAEYRNQSADGAYHWERSEFSTIFGSDGKPVKTIIAVEDTTERHRQYELEQSRPTLGEENLLVHALFNLNTGETLDYAYRDGTLVPAAERTAFLFGGDNLDTSIVNEDERERYRRLNDPKELLARYAKGETELSIDYRRRMPGGEIIWVRNLLHMVQEPGGSDILLFEYCYNIEEEKTRQLMYGALINENYDYVAKINGKNRHYSVLFNTNVHDKLVPQSGDDFDATAVFAVNARVHPADQALCLKNLTVNGMKENLRSTDRFQFTFRVMEKDGGVLYKKITQRYLDREREILLMTREDVTVLMQEEVRKNELLEAALIATSEESLVKEREAAERLRIILDNVNGGMSATALVDGKIKYLFANAEFYSLFGYTKEQFETELSRGMRDLIHPEDLAAFDQAVMDTENLGAIITEVRAIKRDGSLIWVRNIGSLCHFSDIDAPVYIVVTNDITKERKAADDLRMSYEQFRIAASIGDRAIARYDIKTGVYHHQDQMLQAMGYDKAVANVPEVFIQAGNIAPESVDDYRDYYERIRSGQKCVGLDCRLRLADGSFRWARLDATVVFDADDKPARAIIVISDITELREKEAVYRRWQQSLQQRPKDNYTLFRCNLNKNTSYDSVEGSLVSLDFSPEADTFNGRTKEFVNQLVYPEDREKYLAFLNSDTLLANYYRGVRTKTLEFRELRADNSLRWLRLTVELVEYPNSTDIEAYLMYEDIDETKKSELRTKERAETDPLTGVLNRAAFAQAVEHMIGGPSAEGSLALMMLDIDGFKLVNDTFGHAAGDEVLIDLTRSLRTVLRQGDILGRLGGDEFLICLPGMSGDDTIKKKAGEICSLLYKALSLDVYLSVSIGIAVYPRDGKDFETLYRKMDTALYVVKDNGKNHYALFSENMESEYAIIGAPQGLGKLQELMAKRKKRRLLIVDDNQVSLNMLEKLFVDDFIIETAADGAEAMACLKRFGSGIAAVLLDLVMPGMDGFAVLEQMRANAEMQSIPVIVVSGMTEQETSLRTIRCGAADFVTKPIDPDLIRLRVQSVISKTENDRLRAQNSLLRLHNTEVSRYRTALESAGAAIIEVDPESGAFLYDASIADMVAGSFDERPLWDVLLQAKAASAAEAKKIKRLVDQAAAGELAPGAHVTVTLKTASGQKRPFRISAGRRDDGEGAAEKIILTLFELDGGPS